jgi:hypothetical protein
VLTGAGRVGGRAGGRAGADAAWLRVTAVNHFRARARGLGLWSSPAVEEQREDLAQEQRGLGGEIILEAAVPQCPARAGIVDEESSTVGGLQQMFVAAASNASSCSSFARPSACCSTKCSILAMLLEL